MATKPKPPAREPSIFDYGAGDTNTGTSNTTTVDGVDYFHSYAPAGSVWFPKPVPNVIISTGAIGQAVDAINNPESAVYNADYTKASLAGSLNSLPPMAGQLMELVAAGRGHGSTPNGVLQGYIAESSRLGDAGQKVSPVQLAYDEAVKKGWITKDGKVGNVGGSRGGYNGPVTRTDFEHIGEGDLKTLADQVSMEMIGRGVNAKEFERIAKRVLRAENRNPQVTTTTPHGQAAVTSVTDQGMTASDRQDVIQKIVAQNPHYGDYQKATTMMDWFDAALNERAQSAK